MSFEQARAKLTIGSLDDNTTVSAQYNPKELQIDMLVPWKKPRSANNAGSQSGGGGSSPLSLEFGGAEPRTLTVEMLFDGYEKDGGRAVDVRAEVAQLTKLATVRESGSSDEQRRRPHFCVISWGSRGLPHFECVIESLSTKYTMFSSDGEPLRATCTVKLKEASMSNSR